MATLHVRNVPDELYELLRERAAANDRSIGAETVQLLQERLSTPSSDPQPRLSPARRRGGGPFARFTATARAAVASAQEQARELGHGRVGTEHLLLGVLAGDRRTALLRVLRELHVTADRVRAELPGPDDDPPASRPPYDADAKEALELALREALTRRDAAVAPAHLLLGILGVAGGRGARILVGTATVDRAGLRERILGTRREIDPQATLRWTPSASFRVLPLEGDAATWETQLNEAATLGYDLVAVVEGRAILRRV